MATHRYDLESLRQWAEDSGHADDYRRCNGCRNARQDCTCGGDDDDKDIPQCKICGEREGDCECKEEDESETDAGDEQDRADDTEAAIAQEDDASPWTKERRD